MINKISTGGTTLIKRSSNLFGRFFYFFCKIFLLTIQALPLNHDNVLNRAGTILNIQCILVEIKILLNFR